MTDFDNTNRGALFRNDNRKSDNHPEYSGSINVDGHDYWLSAWLKDGKKGKFFSLSVKRKDGTSDRPSQPAPKQQPQSFAGLGDEIPF